MGMLRPLVWGVLVAAAGGQPARADGPATIHLRVGPFDPASAVPVPPPGLVAAEHSLVLLVQVHAGPVDEFLAAVRGLGGEDFGYVPDHCRVIRLASNAHAALAALPQVRWVGPYHPWYKLDAAVAADDGGPSVHSILVWQRGLAMQSMVADRVAAMGGRVLRLTPEGFRVEAMITGAQARRLAGMDEVWFIDRPGPAGLDLDIVRAIGGGSFVQDTLGMTGSGVRGEIMDSAALLTHAEFAGHQTIQHGPPRTESLWHGTRVFGLLFSKGVGNPQSRGLLPDAQPIFANHLPFFNNVANRYTHTAELVDPSGPYRAVFQSNSWGHLWTTGYTTVSAEMDDILFLNDLVVTQSQSNRGNPESRQEAWAKNIVSVGGVIHFGTLGRADDCWGCAWVNGPPASTGPASDGRIKPDLIHFYDQTFTTSDTCNTCYDAAFYGTSNASPLVAGHMGLMMEMWHRGLFAGHGGGSTVFDSRPHMTTAKAMLINSAYRYGWGAGGPNGDMTRVRQGWGMPDLRRLYDGRGGMLIVDESSVLPPQGSAEYRMTVGPGEPELRATMTWADPMGSPGASVHRVNDLTLRLTSPGGVVYWGNQGLMASNWSTPGGEADTINTVENVFIQNPQAGEWRVEVIASEVNVDGRVQTPEMDADFALVVAGVTPGCYANCDGSTTAPTLNVGDYVCFLNKFAAGDGYANCDGSSIPPVLNVNDFVCFHGEFVSGCP